MADTLRDHLEATPRPQVGEASRALVDLFGMSSALYREDREQARLNQLDADPAQETPPQGATQNGESAGH